MAAVDALCQKKCAVARARRQQRSSEPRPTRPRFPERNDAAGVPGRSLAPALVFALAVALTLHPIGEPDVWYHLASGRLLWTTRAWPSTNVFAYTAADH